MKEHFKNYYMIYIAAIIGLCVVCSITFLIIAGFYVVAKVFLPNHNPLEAACALTFLTAAITFVADSFIKK